MVLPWLRLLLLLTWWALYRGAANSGVIWEVSLMLTLNSVVLHDNVSRLSCSTLAWRATITLGRRSLYLADLLIFHHANLFFIFIRVLCLAMYGVFTLWNGWHVCLLAAEMTLLAFHYIHWNRGHRLREHLWLLTIVCNDSCFHEMTTGWSILNLLL